MWPPAPPARCHGPAHGKVGCPRQLSGAGLKVVVDAAQWLLARLGRFLDTVPERSARPSIQEVRLPVAWE